MASSESLDSSGEAPSKPALRANRSNGARVSADFWVSTPLQLPPEEGSSRPLGGGVRQNLLANRLTLSTSTEQAVSTAYTTVLNNQIVCKGFTPARGNFAIRPPERRISSAARLQAC